MIYDTLKNLHAYFGISKNLDTALRFLQETDLSSLNNGRNEIDGDNVFVNVMDVNTKPPEQLCYEMHKKYMDIHMDITGQERLLIAPTSTLRETKPYDEEDDFALGMAEAAATCELEQGLFLVCLPQDAHMPGVASGTSGPVHKCVVKVSV